MNRTSNIWEAIESRNYKQALQHVTKALKRSPKDDFYLSLKAYILSLLRKSDEAVELARDIASRQPTDSRILDLIFGVILDSQGLEEAGSLYESAARKRPKDEDLILSWFWAMCTGGDVRGQQKAAMTLHRSFSRRPYTLWAILSCYILGISPIASQQERTLFLTLAARFIPLVEPIQSAEEAILKARVLELQPNLNDVVEFLCDDVTDKWNNLELATMKLENTVKSEKWELVYEIGMKTLLKENRDDYDSWKALANSVMKLDDLEKRSAFESVLSVRAHTRNGRLANVYYGSLRTKSDVLEAAKTYFTTFSTKQCAFEDLRPYVETLEPEEWLAFIDEKIIFKQPYAEYSIAQTNTLVNNRKFHYLLDAKDATFVQTNVDLYNALLPTLQSKSTTDYYVGDDLLLLAATWILDGRPVDSTLAEEDSIYAVIVLLETACNRDPHQFYIRLWLTRLYLYVGSFQQASWHYNSLSIKNIQIDVLSHFLLTRVSTVFPAWRQLIATRDCYDMNAVQTPQNIKLAYESSTFSQIAGFTEFNQRLSDSVNKGILVVEAKRTARMLSLKMEGLAINPRLASTSWRDNRDYAIMFGISDSERTTEQQYRIGPKQTGGWVNSFIYRESLIESLTNSEARQSYSTKLSVLLTSSEAADLTDSETWTMNVALKLAEVAEVLTKESMTPLQDVLADGIKEFAPADSVKINWKWLHDRFIVLETIKTTIAGLDQLGSTPAARRNGKLTASIAAIKKGLVESGNNIKEAAQAVKLGREKWARETAARISEYKIISDLDKSNVDIGDFLEGIGKSQSESLTILRNVKLL